MTGGRMTKGAAKSARGEPGASAPGSRAGAPGIDRRAAVGALGLCALAAAACDTGQLPNDATLSISPASRSIEIVEVRDAGGRCTFDPGRFVDLPMVMRLTGPDGSPIGDAEVAVYVDFGANTWSGFPALALYEDRNGNGVVDADSELASGADDDVARVRTDPDGGARAMLLRVNVSCPYRGEVFAHVGGVTAESSIEVVARETSEPDPVPAETVDRAPGDGSDDGQDADVFEESGPDLDDDGAAEPADGEPSTTGPEGDDPTESDPNPFELEPEPVVDLDPADPDSDAPPASPDCVGARSATPAVPCAAGPEILR